MSRSPIRIKGRTAEQLLDDLAQNLCERDPGPDKLVAAKPVLLVGAPDGTALVVSLAAHQREGTLQ